MTDDLNPLDEPVFCRRPQKDRYQVRFWSTPAEYESFTKACEKEGLYLQDVFNDFMCWFSMASREERLNIQEWAP